MKTEHNGAKNGGGHWGTRAEAKRLSSKQRRLEDNTMARDNSPRAQMRNVIRASDRVRLVPGINGSPATMERGLANRYLAEALRDWDDTRARIALGSGESLAGYEYPHIEEYTRSGHRIGR